MLYDLELDENFNIIGGQWRTTEVGRKFLNIGADRDQPDFFWVIRKDWRESGYYTGVELSEWDGRKVPAPRDWRDASEKAQKFEYISSYAFGNQKCRVTNSEIHLKVPCEMKTNRPQPLVNVLQLLIKRSQSLRN